MLILGFLLAGCTLDRRGDDTHCRIHGLRLQEDLVPILWGLPVFEKDYLDAAERKFPRSNRVFYGGCVPGDQSRAWVLYCPSCREAEERWSRDRNPR